MSKSIAVLGLGKYGRSLAENLFALGGDVMVVDRNQEIIQDFSAKSTFAICADLENEEEVMALGLQNMDMVVVSMGSTLAASVMCVVAAKDLGVPFVMAKASSARMATILTKVGADKVIDPEAESGMRSAWMLASPAYLEVFGVDDNLCMVEMVPEKRWVGRSLRQLELRSKLNVNIVATRQPEGKWTFADPEQPIGEDTRLLAALERKDLRRFQ